MVIKENGKQRFFVEVDESTYYHLEDIHDKLGDIIGDMKDILSNPISEDRLEEYYEAELREAEKKEEESDYYEDMYKDRAFRQNELAREFNMTRG